MKKLSIQTTQNVAIEYEAASLGERLGAYFIDAAVLYGYIFGFIIIWGQLSELKLLSWMSSDVSITLFYLFVFVPLATYDLISEIVLNGQTIGKRQRNLRIIKLDGSAPNVGDYLVRWLFRIVDIYFFGAVAMLLIAAGGRGQRLGDMAAGTTVVRIQSQIPLPYWNKLWAAIQRKSDYVPSFPQSQLLSDEEANLMEEALLFYQHHGNPQVIHALAEKLTTLLQIQPPMPPNDLRLIETLLNDYTYFTLQNHPNSAKLKTTAS